MHSMVALPESAGYVVVCGVGFFFAFLMCGISHIQVSMAAPELETFTEERGGTL